MDREGAAFRGLVRLRAAMRRGRSPNVQPTIGPGDVPNRLAAAISWAGEALVARDWEDAVHRWEAVMDRFGASVPPKGYVRLAAAYRELGLTSRAAAVINHGRGRHPGDARLAIEWAQQAMVEENWGLAVHRWQQVAAEFDAELPARAIARMAASHWEYGDVQQARQILAGARGRFPEDGQIVKAEALLALVLEDWHHAFELWASLLDRFPEAVTANDLSRLAVALRRQGEHERALATVTWAMAKFPGDVRVVGEAAHVAMARSEWVAAVRHWQRVSELSTDRPDLEMSFPRQSSVGDWLAVAWRRVGQAWDTIAAELPDAPDGRLFLALAQTMANADLHDDAVRMLERGLTAFPDDPSLGFAYASARLLPPGDDAERLHALARELRGVPALSRTCRALAALAAGEPVDRTDALAVAVAENDARLRSFHSDVAQEGLPSFHILRVPRGSSIELQVRAGPYLDPEIIRERVLEVSQRDRWPEMYADENLVLKRARELADSFGKRYERTPYLPADVLSDAVLFLLFHEVCVAQPMFRIAADIAAEVDDAPVFVETSSLTFRYLDGYTFTRFDVVYLYAELRRRGVNAFLVTFIDDDEDEDFDHVGLRFSAGARAMLPRGEVERVDEWVHREAVVPAGIRSVRRVLGALGESPLVYASGSVIKEFAYDRSIQQAFPIEPGASVHPPRDRLPTFTFDLWAAGTVEGVQLNRAGDRSVRGRIDVSPVVGGDWLGWLDAAVGDFLEEMAVRCAAETSVRRIETLHVSDHLFAEGAIFGSAVKRQGGRVILWPHSANPVHVTVRRSASFDEVHAITHAGVEQWRERFPGKVVVHSPRLMLDPPVRDAVIDPASPLNVVVIGGRSSLRDLPILDRTAHEESYRAFFAGLQRLQERLALQVQFKPRGVTGEHEMWLFHTVGTSAAWGTVLEHPMRLQLPNMLFVAISMGSSALLEGISRGIPGFIVRDFPVRDYTTLDEDAIPIVRSEVALEIVASCAHPGGLEALLAPQIARYTAEFAP